MLLRALGRTIVIISEPDIATDLLEQRSMVYSSRPQSILAPLCVPHIIHASLEMLTLSITFRAGWDWNMAFFPYGSTWKQYRRILWEYYHPDVAKSYRPCQTEYARRLLPKLLSDVDGFIEHVRK